MTLASALADLSTFVGSPGAGEAAGSGMLGVWQSVLDFVTISGNAMARLGIYAWLFVMGVGGIRKLVTGI